MTLYGLVYGSSAGYASTEAFHNSIFVNTVNGAIGGAGSTADYSIFYNNGSDLGSGVVDNGGNMFATNPLFASTDPNSPNFLMLQPNSPAIGAASDSGLYAGNDIGALGAVVPEPVSGSLLFIGLPMLLLRKRRVASGT